MELIRRKHYFYKRGTFREKFSSTKIRVPRYGFNKSIITTYLPPSRGIHISLSTPTELPSYIGINKYKRGQNERECFVILIYLPLSIKEENKLFFFRFQVRFSHELSLFSKPIGITHQAYVCLLVDIENPHLIV